VRSCLNITKTNASDKCVFKHTAHSHIVLYHEKLRFEVDAYFEVALHSSKALVEVHPKITPIFTPTFYFYCLNFL